MQSGPVYNCIESYCIVRSSAVGELLVLQDYIHEISLWNQLDNSGMAKTQYLAMLRSRNTIYSYLFAHCTLRQFPSLLRSCRRCLEKLVRYSQIVIVHSV